jgi:hypothetical protein
MHLSTHPINIYEFLLFGRHSEQDEYMAQTFASKKVPDMEKEENQLKHCTINRI